MNTENTTEQQDETRVAFRVERQVKQNFQAKLIHEGISIKAKITSWIERYLAGELR